MTLYTRTGCMDILTDDVDDEEGEAGGEQQEDAEELGGELVRDSKGTYRRVRGLTDPKAAMQEFERVVSKKVRRGYRIVRSA